MQSLTQFINESRISPYELKKYAKSAITNSTNYRQYIQYLQAVLDGVNEGIVENLRYYKDQREIEDAENFLKIIDDFMELLKKSTK